MIPVSTRSYNNSRTGANVSENDSHARGLEDPWHQGLFRLCNLKAMRGDPKELCFIQPNVQLCRWSLS